MPPLPPTLGIPVPGGPRGGPEIDETIMEKLACTNESNNCPCAAKLASKVHPIKKGDIDSDCYLKHFNNIWLPKATRKPSRIVKENTTKKQHQHIRTINWSGPPHPVSLRAIFLLTLRLLTLLESNFPGNPLWAWEFHPLNLRFRLSHTL